MAYGAGLKDVNMEDIPDNEVLENLTKVRYLFNFRFFSSVEDIINLLCIICKHLLAILSEYGTTVQFRMNIVDKWKTHIGLLGIFTISLDVYKLFV